MIEIISGTNRPGANALKVAKVLEGLYREHGAEVQILNLQELPREIFDSTSYASKPDSFKPFQDRVLAADGLHIVTPEYNGSFPGVLKYFIDMLKFPESFEHRCVAFTGEAAGIWGGFRSCEQIQMIFGYRNAYPLPERVFIPQIHEKLSDDGKMTDDKTLKMLKSQVAQFIAFVDRNKGIAPQST